jgi:hypothetical protein
MDGRTLACPVNYVLVRVAPPPDAEIDAAKRPFVIVDPRAGHGPGIGGFKPQSEILCVVVCSRRSPWKEDADPGGGPASQAAPRGLRV